MYKNYKLPVTSPSTDDDKSNPWFRFHRLIRNCVDNKVIGVDGYACSNNKNGEYDGIKRHVFRKKLFVGETENTSSDPSDRLLGHDSCALTVPLCHESALSPTKRSTHSTEDSNVDINDAAGNLANEICNKYKIPWQPDPSSDVEFALECSIENCDCSERWSIHRESLYASFYSPPGVDGNNSGNILINDCETSSASCHVYSESADMGSRIRNMTCSLSSCDCRQNQWSPFVRESRSDEYIKTNGSFKHTQEHKGNAVSDESFEIVEWSANDHKYAINAKQVNQIRWNDAYDTPMSSPNLDLSGLDGYHTAPNSPESVTDTFFVIDGKNENSTNHAVVDYSTTDATVDRRRLMTDSSELRTTPSEVNNVLETKSTECLKCSKCNQDIKTSQISDAIVQASANNIEPSISEDHNPMRDVDAQRNDHETDTLTFQRQEFSNYSNHDNRVLKLETPPIITADNINYEGDPKSGQIVVIGKGSFGVVYKARFSDPNFSHIPLVVKEFDEEFSNSKEIFEEAQRLYYLQDTGYVPICYGILYYGHNDQNKYGIVQELVGTGLTLEQMLWDQYELPVEYWFRIALQSCEGLARFHEKGILLNDIKTNNILLEFSANAVRIRYIDFGLATDMRGKRYKNTKSLEDFVYLAPEVRVNGGVTNIASDTFSLGFMLEQIKKFSGIYELSVVARLCMDIDPTMRLPVRGAASLITDQMANLGLGKSRTQK